MDILLWIVFGLVVGLVARLIMPGSDPGGIIVTIVLGIVGALLGGWLGRAIGLYREGEAAGFIMAVIGAIIVLAILSLFRWIENKLPTEHYAHLVVGFARAKAVDEAQLRKLIADNGFSVANLSSRLTDRGETFEYRMMIKSRGRDATDALSQHLRALPDVTEFRISPTGD